MEILDSIINISCFTLALYSINIIYIMIIYQLLNFFNDKYLFTEKGEYVFDYSYCLASFSYPKSARVHYKKSLNEAPCYITTAIDTQSLDFNKFPPEIQCLFKVYKSHIFLIKACLTDTQWNELLALHPKNT